MSDKAVYFITADDEFIAANRAREIFDEKSKDVIDDMSKEIIDCTASKASDVVAACNKAMSAAATVPLFGGKTVVWMRGVNFFADNRQNKSEEADNALQKLADFLPTISFENVNVIISASPVDRRKKTFKDIQKISECEDFQSKDPSEACMALIADHAKKSGLNLEYGAVETLAATVANNPRMAVQELDKLGAYVNWQRTITERDVVDMTPIFGEGDFFDISNAFYSGNLEGALSALYRYFFANKNASARPIVTVLQKQNSLLIQIRSLMDAGVLSRTVSAQPRGAVEEASKTFGEFFGDSKTKSNYNLFSQNAWYVGNKLAPIAGKFPLKKLFDMQMSIAGAFEDLISRPGSDHQILRDLFVKCLSE